VPEKSIDNGLASEPWKVLLIGLVVPVFSNDIVRGLASEPWNVFVIPVLVLFDLFVATGCIDMCISFVV
jgi:hypothetical protein